MNIRTLFRRLVMRRPREVKPRTVIHQADFEHPPVGHYITELTEHVIRANEGESYEPPPALNHRRWRPDSDHW